MLSTDAFGGGGTGKHPRMITFKEHRGSSPNPDIKDIHSRRPADIPEIMWFEEGNDLIRSCAALSSALGIQKSFSTSDITQLPGPESLQNHQLAHAVSELALNSLQRCGYMLDNPRLDHASRSCSTWVAVGELASTSQLPSPHGGPANTSHQLTTNTPPPPAFTAADLIRSVNKKVRQNYIRRRLLTTYRAIERLSQSEFNLDRLEAAAAAATAISGPGPTELVVPALVVASSSVASIETDCKFNLAVGGPEVPETTSTVPTTSCKSTTPKSTNSTNVPKTIDAAMIKKKISMNITKNITIHDIEKERGKPLSKYDRNIMIFNWLHTLDEGTVDEDNMVI